MKRITLLTDYKGGFGSKFTAKPYRSGMDKDFLTACFREKGYETQYLPFPEVNLRQQNYDKQYVLYTSTEDDQYLYKSYIEDVCHALTLQGAILIPAFKFLRAHSNKVFMEMLRDLSMPEAIKTIASQSFGCWEELADRSGRLAYPTVIKGAGGAKSSFVALAQNETDLLKKARKLSSSENLTYDMRDLARQMKHKGYIAESKHRKKILVQTFVENLSNDWKILIFGSKYYVLYRQTRENDFRASGSGKFRFPTDVPGYILDFAKAVYDEFKVPNLSIDVGYDGRTLYLFEFQAIYFGSTTLEKSPFHYYRSPDGAWAIRESKSVLEKEYAESVVEFIARYYN